MSVCKKGCLLYVPVGHGVIPPTGIVIRSPKYNEDSDVENLGCEQIGQRQDRSQGKSLWRMLAILSILGNQAAKRKLIISGMPSSQETSHGAQAKEKQHITLGWKEAYEMAQHKPCPV